MRRKNTEMALLHGHTYYIYQCLFHVEVQWNILVTDYNSVELTELSILIPIYPYYIIPSYETGVRVVYETFARRCLWLSILRVTSNIRV